MTSSPEFSRQIAIEGIVPDKTRIETIEANEDECAELAARLGIREIESLKAKLTIRRVSGGSVVKVAGEIKADVVQACVVSLQDVHQHIESAFDTFFSQESAQEQGKEVEFSAEDEDAPEMVVNGMIDMGEIVAQYLSLELDPYPRAPGVSLAAQLTENGQGGKNRPFAVLEGLKQPEEKD